MEMGWRDGRWESQGQETSLRLPPGAGSRFLLPEAFPGGSIFSLSHPCFNALNNSSHIYYDSVNSRLPIAFPMPKCLTSTQMAQHAGPVLGSL